LHASRSETDRDLRVDFFRGLALIFIFVDHIPGNVFARATLTNFGFADAAEIFVLLAGYAAFLAYSKSFDLGLTQALRKIALRIRDLYVAHLLVLVVCVAGLAVAARVFQNPVYFEHVNLIPFNADPAGAIARALVLLYQPGYLNILPLYILLLLWLPCLIMLMRLHTALALSASAAIWAVCGLLQLNLLSYPGSYGWVFNPFAWQLLFTLGAISASRSVRWPQTRPQGSSLLLWIAIAYVLFAFVVAAPWTRLPGLTWARVLPDFRTDISKQYLSSWRLAHIVALGYIAASLIPRCAKWLDHTWARLVINCGQHSLPVFCLSIVLSLSGFVVLVEAGRGLLLQTAVNTGGIALLGLTAWKLAKLKVSRRQAGTVADGARASGWLSLPF
jgi:hypothetical protein